MRRQAEEIQKAVEASGAMRSFEAAMIDKDFLQGITDTVLSNTNILEKFNATIDTTVGESLKAAMIDKDLLQGITDTAFSNTNILEKFNATIDHAELFKGLEPSLDSLFSDRELLLSLADSEMLDIARISTDSSSLLEALRPEIDSLRARDDFLETIAETNAAEGELQELPLSATEVHDLLAFILASVVVVTVSAALTAAHTDLVYEAARSALVSVWILLGLLESAADGSPQVGGALLTYTAYKIIVDIAGFLEGRSGDSE